MTSCQNDKLSKWQVVTMTSCQTDKLSKWQVVKMLSCQNSKLTMWHVDKVSSWQNGTLASLQSSRLTKWQVAKMPNWQIVLAPKNNGLLIIKLVPDGSNGLAYPVALLLKLGMLTAGMDPLAAMDPRAASSSNPAKDPWEGKGWVLQLRKVSSLSMLPKRSNDLYWKSFFLENLKIFLSFS